MAFKGLFTTCYYILLLKINNSKKVCLDELKGDLSDLFFTKRHDDKFPRGGIWSVPGATTMPEVRCLKNKS